MRKATSDPTLMVPLAMRLPPNQITATLDTLITTVTVGNITAISRPERSDVPVRSALPWRKRSVSSGSRTKARTTRMPVSCSRSTWLMRSMRTCMRRNWGIMREIVVPTASSSTGMATTRIHARPTSWLSARMMPPAAVMGAATSIVHVMSTSICTCCTSFVMRVISDGAPNCCTSCAEKPVTWWKSAARTSRPKPIDACEPKYTAATAKTICTSVTTSMMPPTRQM